MREKLSFVLFLLLLLLTTDSFSLVNSLLLSLTAPFLPSPPPLAGPSSTAATGSFFLFLLSLHLHLLLLTSTDASLSLLLLLLPPNQLILLQINCVLQEVQFTDQQRFKQFVSQSKARMEAVFPDNTYGVDSGGDPKVIPQLKFEQFKEFHNKYYHPSNARIWFYGDDDPIEHLRILSEYLVMFDASSAPNESKIKPQKFFSETIKIVEEYPAGEEGDLQLKHIVILCLKRSGGSHCWWRD